jgi:hypothetical protein
MKGGVRQVHLRQHQDEGAKQQQRHQKEQTQRLYLPAFHGTKDNTILDSTKPHESATRLRGPIVGRKYAAECVPSHRPQHDHAGVVLKTPPAVSRCCLHQPCLQPFRGVRAMLPHHRDQTFLTKRFLISIAGFD